MSYSGKANKIKQKLNHNVYTFIIFTSATKINHFDLESPRNEKTCAYLGIYHPWPARSQNSLCRRHFSNIGSVVFETWKTQEARKSFSLLPHFPTLHAIYYSSACYTGYSQKETSNPVTHSFFFFQYFFSVTHSWLRAKRHPMAIPCLILQGGNGTRKARFMDNNKQKIRSISIIPHVLHNFSFLWSELFYCFNSHMV